ncbi:sulfotransferase family protein [Rubidibacter lacunae KORDI 51-2]|uniref:Sulfotransferase family protein n=1 Tax=Rubidibacter lacunae KORDI 51-2 TaxID=582515 RepID=U5DPX1_9CHRO|nr:sulfotransferase family 2 domain-containing protein [Rubidibacter lacunae]ERN41750.1 sulfotransferase family protein [Rubidibacter lacunae KORDI 51-2]
MSSTQLGYAKLNFYVRRAYERATSFRLKGLFATEKFVYLHIPKTAGTAIKKHVERAGYRNYFALKGHKYTVWRLPAREQQFFTFASIRNPLTWYVSLYNFKVKSQSADPAVDYPRMTDNSFADFFRDLVLCENGVDGVMRWNKPYRPHVREMVESLNSLARPSVGFLTHNFLYYCYSNWRDCLASADPSAEAIARYREGPEIDYMLRLEHLQSDFNAMVAKLAPTAGISVDLQGRINQTARRDYLDYYTDDMMASVRQRDRAIFELFGYN